ncbi:hypothetical protein McaMca56_000812 [Microsporum canis]
MVQEEGGKKKLYPKYHCAVGVYIGGGGEEEEEVRRNIYCRIWIFRPMIPSNFCATIQQKQDADKLTSLKEYNRGSPRFQ